MNFEIKKCLILSPLARAVNATNKEYPAIKLTVNESKNELIIEGSSGISSIKANINSVFVRKGGQALVDGKVLYEIVKRLNEGEIGFEVTGSKLKIKSETSNFELRLMQESSIYNRLPREYSYSFKLETQKLIKAIKNTSFACAVNQPSRMILSGVLFIISDKMIKVVATDSFRAAKDLIRGEFGLGDNEIKVVIPQDSLNDLLKIAHGQMVDMLVSDSTAKFVFENCTFETSLLEGNKYPDVMKFLTPDSTSSMIKVVQKNELIQALERVSVLIDPAKTTAIILNFEDKLKVTIPDTEIGTGTEILAYSGETTPVAVACSYKFLLDALKTFEGNEIEMYTYKDLKPVHIFANNEDVHQLVLPVKM